MKFEREEETRKPKRPWDPPAKVVRGPAGSLTSAYRVVNATSNMLSLIQSIAA